MATTVYGGQQAHLNPFSHPASCRSNLSRLNTQLNKFQRISSVFDMNSLFFKNVTGNGFKKILTLRFTEDLEDLVLPRSSEDLK